MLGQLQKVQTMSETSALETFVTIALYKSTFAIPYHTIPSQRCDVMDGGGSSVCSGPNWFDRGTTLLK